MKPKAYLRYAAYTGLFIFFTWFFLVVNYPSDRLTGQVNAWIQPASDGILNAGNARIKPLLSLELENITAKLDSGPLDIGSAVVNPGILKILSGKTAADIHLTNPWLKSDMKVVSSKENLHLDVKDARIDLSMLPEDIFPVPLEMEGMVEMSMKLLKSNLSGEVTSGDARIASGTIQIGGDLLETLGFSPLKISRVSAVATARDNVVTLGENTIEGDLNASARGVIRLSTGDFYKSRLDLTVEISPGPGNRERLAPVLALLGARVRADGSIIIHVRGTLERPSVTM